MRVIMRYHPGAEVMSIKIVFDPETGKLFGAQIVGFEGVDKRIDMLAHILKHGETIYEMQEIEHAYAPPFSSAKDPVNIAGMAAENIVTGRVKIIHWEELREMDKNDYYLVDVRTPDEYALGDIDGSTNIPLQGFRDQLQRIPKDRRS